jgi:hypothetical protein
MNRWDVTTTHSALWSVYEEIMDGPFPLPSERAREIVIADIQWRIGRLAALITWWDAIDHDADTLRMRDEIDMARASIDHARMLSQVYSEGEHWRSAPSADWFGLAV